MARLILAVIAGFFVWIVLWLGIETVLSAVMPQWYGEPQADFQAAIENGSTTFTAATRLLAAHLPIAALVALAAGFAAAFVSGENKRAPAILAFVLVAIAVLKVAMSWAYAPVWYHLAFTALLPLMTIVGGRLKRPRGS
jgi:hypothetical protein